MKFIIKFCLNDTITIIVERWAILQYKSTYISAWVIFISDNNVSFFPVNKQTCVFSNHVGPFVNFLNK